MMRLPPRLPRLPRSGAALFVCVTLATLAALGSAPPAHAAKVSFGQQDYLNKLQDIDVKGADGAALYLGYKHSIHSFIAPYMVSDDGYILGVVGQNRYIKLDAAMIASMQARGQLPKPLPPYELSIWDYIFGNLAWIILGGLIIGGYLASRGEARKKKAIPIAQEGLAQEQAGNFDGAIASYTKALEINPKFGEVLRLRAAVHHQRGNLDLAIADFSRAISAEPKNDSALIGRGQVFEAKSMAPQAIEDYSRAIRIGKSPLAHYLRGVARTGIGQLQPAVEDFDAAFKSAPSFASAYLARATAQEGLGLVDAAAADRRLGTEMQALAAAAPALPR
jgi:tetratricopeptide (TPR) repeat protein